MSTESLFNAVKNLQKERQLRHEDMMNFMKGLSGTGQVGYGIGYGLSRLFGDSGTDEQMLQAQREDAYAKQYMMETDPVKRNDMRQGAYALSAEFGRKLDAVDAAQSKAQLDAAITRAKIANYESEIKARGTGKPTEIKAPSKPTVKMYEDLISATPAFKTAISESTDWVPEWAGGTINEGKLTDLLIERANTIRQQIKGTSLRDSMRMAIEEYTVGAPNMTASQSTAPSTQQTDTRTLIDAAQP